MEMNRTRYPIKSSRCSSLPFTIIVISCRDDVCGKEWRSSFRCTPAWSKRMQWAGEENRRHSLLFPELSSTATDGNKVATLSLPLRTMHVVITRVPNCSLRFGEFCAYKLVSLHLLRNPKLCNIYTNSLNLLEHQEGCLVITHKAVALASFSTYPPSAECLASH